MPETKLCRYDFHGNTFAEPVPYPHDAQLAKPRFCGNANSFISDSIKCFTGQSQMAGEFRDGPAGLFKKRANSYVFVALRLYQPPESLPEADCALTR